MIEIKKPYIPKFKTRDRGKEEIEISAIISHNLNRIVNGRMNHILTSDEHTELIVSVWREVKELDSRIVLAPIDVSLNWTDGSYDVKLRWK